ncbi:iron-containing alcohol dehydrogenase [Chitinivorax tropicus]|nr:iron-containing alcohol dehydrogenase [Chitinivorax tropicus]
MQNFVFHNPTKVVFGQDTIQQLDQLIPTNARVLVLLGGQSAKTNGTLDLVRQALGNRQVSEFNGIEPNPTYETLMEAVAQVKREQIDYLLAVGGGSVIDGTKFVAAAAVFDGDPWDILTSWGKAVTRALPLGVVLTLPATGSETNCNAVVTRRATHSKRPFNSPHVYAQFAVLDPTRTYTLPKRQIANGLADAFVHIIEQYLTYPVQAMAQDRFAEGLLQTLIELAPGALADQPDYQQRANLMWTASLALNGLLATGVPQDWATHMIGHELTARYGIDHARTLAMVLPALMQVQRHTKHAKLLQYAERVWHITTGDDAERIDEAIARTRQFFESLGIGTTLRDYDLDERAIDEVVAQLIQHGMVALGEHQDITPDVSRRILSLALGAANQAA